MTAVTQENRVDRRKRRTRHRLIQAMRRLTGEKGIDAVNIRDIAAEADIAVGSFYNHFDSKETLLQAAVEDLIEELGQTIDHMNADADDAATRVATAFVTLDRRMHDDPILGWFVVRVSGYRPDWARALFRRFLADLQRGNDEGTFDLPRIDLAAEMASACLLSFGRSRLRGDVDDATVTDFLHLALRLLGTDDAVARSTAERVARSRYPQA